MRPNSIRYTETEWNKFLIRSHLESHPYCTSKQSYTALKQSIRYTKSTFNKEYCKIKCDITRGTAALPAIDSDHHISTATRYNRLRNIQRLLLQHTTKADIIWILNWF